MSSNVSRSTQSTSKSNFEAEIDLLKKKFMRIAKIAMVVTFVLGFVSTVSWDRLNKLFQN